MSAKQISKYFGVAPRLYESGTKRKALENVGPQRSM
ncbi:hypothetical protein [Chryseobacterium sp. Marseille-Q8038]